MTRLIVHAEHGETQSLLDTRDHGLITRELGSGLNSATRRERLR
jgi:hypothetical protein